MKFSDEFEKRFREMLTHYPTKRSCLVPTLLYAQDEAGYLSDEVIAEIAGRLELTELDVRNVISYYSMLITKPRGKFDVQVCTNIACMLRGGEELLEHCSKKLGIGHKGTTPDGVFSLEGSRVHWRMQLGACGSGELRLPRKPDHREDGQDSGRVQTESLGTWLIWFLIPTR
jgi:NADH-quinone oxidoreductase subunit E